MKNPALKVMLWGKRERGIKFLAAAGHSVS